MGDIAVLQPKAR